MKRSDSISRLLAQPKVDLCIIGGGATGLGIAVDAAARGLKTLLLEKDDFAKGTSSRSTKLVHGGVRYLQQGNIKLVMEALRERGLLLKNAPHLVKNQSFVIPNYKWWENPFYGVGLKMYDWMAGSLGLGPSEFLTVEETLERAPTLDPEGLRGGVLYHDGQFDDARLAIHLAMTADALGAILINHMAVTGLLHEHQKVMGVLAMDQENEKAIPIEIRAKVVINATGVFTDSILQMDQPGIEPIVSPSQGIHLVFDREFLPSDTAIMIPKTDDGRVLFAVPWHNKIIVGTTDTPVSSAGEEPTALPEEVDFVLEHIRRYLSQDPTRADIRSVFAGLRPLIKGNAKSTAALSRDHHIAISASELITIAGGKWTTYRKMAEDVVDIAVHKAGYPEKECTTRNLPIHGYTQSIDYSQHGYYYGTDKEKVESLTKEDPSLSAMIHPRLPYTFAEISWAVREEMCLTLEDALSRRTRALLLDARAALEAAPAVATLMRKELGKDEVWENNQVNRFRNLALKYIVT